MFKSDKIKFKLSKNEAEIPVIGLGTWQSAPGEVGQAVTVAIRNGYRHIDTAAVYMNEEEIGNAIKSLINDGVITRKDLFITTKLALNCHRADLVEGACLQSLKKLCVDYIDLYLIHIPCGMKEETGTMISRDKDGKYLYSDVDYVDTFEAMQVLVEKQLVRNLGVSNFNIHQLQRVFDRNFKYPPVCNQVEISPHFRNDSLVSFCQRNGVVMTAYSPLGSPNHPSAPVSRRALLDEDCLKVIGERLKRTSAQIAIRWAIQRNLVVIPKSVTEKRIIENSQVFDFELSDADMDYINSINYQFRVCHIPWWTDHKYYPFQDD